MSNQVNMPSIPSSYLYIIESKVGLPQSGELLLPELGPTPIKVSIEPKKILLFSRFFQWLGTFFDWTKIYTEVSGNIVGLQKSHYIRDEKIKPRSAAIEKAFKALQKNVQEINLSKIPESLHTKVIRTPQNSFATIIKDNKDTPTTIRFINLSQKIDREIPCKWEGPYKSSAAVVEYFQSSSKFFKPSLDLAPDHTLLKDPKDPTDYYFLEYNFSESSDKKSPSLHIKVRRVNFDPSISETIITQALVTPDCLVKEPGVTYLKEELGDLITIQRCTITNTLSPEVSQEDINEVIKHLVYYHTYSWITREGKCITGTRDGNSIKLAETPPPFTIESNRALIAKLKTEDYLLLQGNLEPHGSPKESIELTLDRKKCSLSRFSFEASFLTHHDFMFKLEDKSFDALKDYFTNWSEQDALNRCYHWAYEDISNAFSSYHVTGYNGDIEKKVMYLCLAMGFLYHGDENNMNYIKTKEKLTEQINFLTNEENEQKKLWGFAKNLIQSGKKWRTWEDNHPKY